jgi:hypothetical protein
VHIHKSPLATPTTNQTSVTSLTYFFIVTQGFLQLISTGIDDDNGDYDDDDDDDDDGDDDEDEGEYKDDNT